MNSPEMNNEQTETQMAKLAKSNENEMAIKEADIPEAMIVNTTFLGYRNVFRIQALSPIKPWKTLVRISAMAMMEMMSAVCAALRPFSLQIVLRLET